MSLFVFVSLDALLRHASQYGSHAEVRAMSVQAETMECLVRGLYILFVREVGPHVADHACSFDPPSEKGNWGSHFSKLAEIITQRNLTMLKCSLLDCSEIMPDEDCIFYDAQYHRWRAVPLNLSEAVEEEPAYDWEIVDDTLCSTSKNEIVPETDTPEPVEFGSIEDSSHDCHPYKDALLRHRALEERESMVEEHFAEIAARAPWRPQIVVHDVSWERRKDRSYGLGARAGSEYMTVDLDEEDGLWGLVGAVEDDKMSRAVSRFRGFTILKPEQMAKKAERIAQNS